MNNLTAAKADLPVLYSFRRCPYAIRARLAIQSSGVEVALREILLRDKPAQMLEISAKGTVPVLQLSDGRVIDESWDIIQWALAENDPDNLALAGQPELQSQA
ncbi:MAG: glutathione S-transferase N-terminal domain-containing protein, partial [Gammaproteobacteria bacterium]